MATQRPSLTMVVAISGWLAGQGFAFAQDSGPDTQASAVDSTQLGEVVVTAQRREQSLQSVPVAVTAISGSTAVATGISDTATLSAAVPGLDVDYEGASTTLFLRGVGSQSATAGAEPSVALYVDDVYISSPLASIFNFNNVERIEVLKGPQGTLFGRNATGGVIQVVTKDPSEKPSIDVSLGFGNYDTTSATLYATGGLAPNLAVDLAVIASHQNDGWGRNWYTGQPTYRSKEADVRNKWLWTPTDATTVKLALDYEYSENQDGLGFKGLPGVPEFGGYPYPGFYNTNANTDDYAVNHQFGASLHVTHDFGAVELTDIAAYRWLRTFYVIEEDGTPLNAENAYLATPATTMTEELQISSPKSSSIQWIGGFFYYHDRAGYNPLTIDGEAIGGVINIDAMQYTNSYAGYAQTSIAILPSTHFTAGLRYTEDKRSISGSTSFVGVGVVASASQAQDFSKPTWRFALDRQFTDSIMGYVSYNRGFKSGLFNTVSYSEPAVRPEVLDAYELGVKSELMDHRLRFNVAGYDYHYTNLQVNQFAADTTILVNAASANIHGIDADLTLIPARNLTLTGSAAWIHGTYSSFTNAPYYPDAPLPGALGHLDATGFAVPHAPKYSFNFGAQYKVPTDVGTFDGNVLYSYQDGFFWDAADQVRQPSYGLLNLSAGWLDLSGHYEFRLWGKNLTAAEYYSFGFATNFGTQFSPAAPRTYGASVAIHF